MTALVATRVEAASIGDMADVLAAADLPVLDLMEPDRIFFRFDADVLLGYGGLEGNGPDRLLRSLVVLPDRRGLGVGGKLIAVLEHEAFEAGALRLHLLTNTAARFFRKHGYVDADRATAPAPVAASAQFSSLCPASAAYLVKSLDRTA